MQKTHLSWKISLVGVFLLCSRQTSAKNRDAKANLLESVLFFRIFFKTHSRIILENQNLLFVRGIW